MMDCELGTTIATMYAGAGATLCRRIAEGHPGSSKNSNSWSIHAIDATPRSAGFGVTPHDCPGILSHHHVAVTLGRDVAIRHYRLPAGTDPGSLAGVLRRVRLRCE